MTKLAPRPVPEASFPTGPLPRPEPIDRLPILILYPHNRCNCRCLMCDIWKERKVREIGPDEVARWTEEWKGLGVERVVLSGGEALMHSDLWRICSLLRAAGVGITLLSSGLLLKKEASRIAAYVDDLVVSLDGPPDLHDAIRNVPRAYERLAEGVRAVREAGPDVSITGRCTVQRRNALRLREIVRAASGAGVDRLSFLAVDVSSGAFNRPEGEGATPKEALALRPDELFALAVELDALEVECADAFASGFIVESPQKLRRRLLGYFTALAGVAAFPENVCNAPWISAVIEADGTVRPCFFHAPVGNVREAGSLSAVLNSAEAIAFRRSLDVTTNPVCARCVCTLALKDP